MPFMVTQVNSVMLSSPAPTNVAPRPGKCYVYASVVSEGGNPRSSFLILMGRSSRTALLVYVPMYMPSVGSTLG